MILHAQQPFNALLTTCTRSFEGVLRTFTFLIIILFPSIYAILIPLGCVAQNPALDTIAPLKIQKINSEIKLDGIIDDKAWANIQSFPLREVLPKYDSMPTARTDFLMCYDDDYIYAAGRFYYSDPTDMHAASFKRDFWHWSSDFMGVLFDTFNDNENGLVFLASPAGTRTDINVLNDADGIPAKNANTSWNTFWDVSVAKEKKVWTTEMKIPLSSLRFEVDDEGNSVMGLIVQRWFSQKNQLYTFPLSMQQFGAFGGYRPSQTCPVIFEDMQRHKPLYITPYVLGGFGQSQHLNEAGTMYEKSDDVVYEAGLDVKYGLTSNLTLDVTINPDFAQVEADDQMINLTRFSLYFPEKRLFFQERQGNFDFKFEGMNQLFYSRRIGIYNGEQVRIYGGARVVGRAGPWDIGFLSMQTEKYEDLPSENFSVLRLRKRVINAFSYIGGMVTSRIGTRDSWNTAYALDGIFRLFGYDYLTFKWAQSFENGNTNEAASLAPSKIYLNWNRRGNKGFGYNFTYSRSGEDFNPGIGFEIRNNYTRFGDRLQYGWYPGEKSRWLLNHKVFIEGNVFIRNGKGMIESLMIGPGWEFVTKGNSFFSFGMKQYQDNVDESFSISDDADVPPGKYTFYGIEGAISSRRGNLNAVSSNVVAGTYYDGRRLSFSVSPRANISARLQLEGMYQLNRVVFPERNQEFTGHIGRLKVSTFLDLKHSLIAFIQYNSANNIIVSNIRYRFNPSEGHDFYVVYDEGLNTDITREIPTLPRSNNHTIMLKYSYTFNIGLK